MKTIRLAALAAFTLLIAGAAPASAKINVVAANQDLAWITSTIGGSRVSVDFLARGDQDPHRIEPRPSQVLKLSQADLLVRIGMDLDLWLDPLVLKSANGKVSPGARGYVDASAGIRKLEIPTGKLDPSKGDIHVQGNPHYLFAPSNLRFVARNIADGLERVDSSGKATYEANYSALVSKTADAIRGWNAKLGADRGKPIVTYHKSLIYFLSEFGLREFGNVEPKPGLEPTAGHIASLAADMKGAGVKVILSESFRPRRFSELLAGQSGAKLVIIPGGIGGEKGIDDYFEFIGAVVDRVAAAL